MTDRAPIAVSSWDDLQERIVSIVRELSDDPALGLAAAANPLAALAALGYDVAPASRAEIEDRLRFAPPLAARRQELRAEIFKAAGHEFDLQSAEALDAVLYRELAITPLPDERGCYPALPPTTPPSKPASGGEREDPLAALEGRHPIMAPLLEYRALDASRAAFAPPAAFDAIRRGAVTGGVSNLRIRFKRDGGARSRTTRLDINTASIAEFQTLTGIGPKLAARIVAYRKAHGRFASAEALGNVPEITPQLLSKLLPYITTES